MDLFKVAPLILILPVLGVLFNAFFGRKVVESSPRLGEKYSGWVASGLAVGAFAVALILAFALRQNGMHAEVIHLFDWINIPSVGFHIPWSIQVDTLSVTMMMVVAGVGSLIHIYAIGYMHGDPDFSRFFTYLNLFLFFMLILVSASSYLMLFVGWEGVGLCSFLLIGFWFDRVDKKGQAMNANAARKAFIANRVGDLAMILAMILLFWTFGSLEFGTVFSSAEELFHSGHMVEFGLFQASLGSVLTAVTALFLMGAAGKSAQIPLHIWLPDAMAGPTPVSALIHAATMVTAGIYLITRSNVLFEIVRQLADNGGALLFGLISSPDLVALIGASTALLAGLIAFTQFDIKKVLAYSTISQLGFMIAAVGMGAYVAGMFHLVTHAFFKALLFLSSGSVIHGMEHGHHHLHDHGDVPSDDGDEHHDDELAFDPQDMRHMGGLWSRMPITKWTFLVGALALSGLAPLAGFWSKDEILAHANDHNQLVYWLLTLAAVCTAFYMGRQLKMVFFGKARHEAAAHAGESVPLMTIPLVILSVLAVFGGLLNLPFLSKGAADASHGHASGAYLMLERWLEHSIASFELTEAGVLHLPHTPIVLSPAVAGVSTVLALTALLGAIFIVYRRRPISSSDKDPLQKTPIWWFAVLPLNTLVMKGMIPAFNAAATWLAEVLDWKIWHDGFHDLIVRNSFVKGARFITDVIDEQGIDGLLVNGSAKAVSWTAERMRLVQTGYIRNYALSVFAGVVLLLAYFLLN